MQGSDAGGPTSPSHYLASLYSAAAPEYARCWEPVIRPMGERLVAEMSLGQALVVMDLGVGTGGLLPTIQRAAPSANVIGTDLATGMLRVAHERSPRVSLIASDLSELPFRSSAADAAVMAFVLFLVPSPAAALAEARRILRHRGTLGVTVWGPERDMPGLAIWTSHLDALGAPPDTKPDAVKRDALMDTPEKLQGLLETAGFAEARCWVEHPERRWTASELLTLAVTYGDTARRLRSLDPREQAACRALVSKEISELTEDELTYRPEIVFGIARADQTHDSPARASDAGRSFI